MANGRLQLCIDGHNLILFIFIHSIDNTLSSS